MNCKQYRAKIEEADLAAAKWPAGSGSHAASCEPCRTFSDERAALRGLVAGLSRVDAPPDFEFRLRARMAAAESAEAPSWSKAFWPRAAWLAAAGCLAFAAAFALQMRDSPTPAARLTAAQPAAKPITTPGAEAVSRGVNGEKAVGSPAVELQAAAAETKSNAAAAARRVARTAPSAAARAARSPQARPAPTAAAQPPRVTVASGGARAAQSESSTSSMSGAPVLVSTAIPLPVAAGEQPLQVLFKDMQGESRIVNVNPVAFGSNEPATRPANVTFTKAAKKQGVW